MTDLATQLVVALAAVLQFIIGLALAMGSVYIGLKMFDKLTKGVNEWDEIKKGNIAVGIMLAAIIIAIATVVQSGVLSITKYIDPTKSLGVIGIGVLVGMVNLLIAIAAAIVAIYIAVRVFDKITKDIDEMKEIAAGNVSVAVIMAGVLIAVSFVISAAVAGFSNVLNANDIAAGLGL